MSTSNPEGTQQGQQAAGGEREPSLADLTAIGAAAANAAAEAKSAAEAATASAEAARTEAGSRGLTIPEEVVKQISEASAGAVVAQLRQIGAIREDGTPPPEGGAGAAAATPPEGGQAASESEAAGGSDPAPERPKTIAEKFLGL